MTGIFLVAVVGLWFWLCVVVARALLRHLRPRPRPWRWFAAATLFALMVVAPVGDEIVGGFQFRALCKKNAVFRVGVERPEGRVTRFFANSPNETVPGTAITIYHTAIDYIDAQTGESVVRFDRYLAQGGVFIRTLGISQSNAPITMERPSCSPEQARGESVHRTLKFSVIN